MNHKYPWRVSRRAFVASTAAGVALSNGIGCGREHAMVTGNDPQDSGAPRLSRYPVYRARGTHREIGRQHGEQAQLQIKAHLDFICRSLKLSRTEMGDRALQFRPLFEKHCPHLLDEIAGLGDGAGISFADALAVNIRGALRKAPEGGCTAFVIAGRGSSNGEILIGQNSDMLPAIMEFAYVLHVKPEGKPEALMWTFGGMIGYHGINSAGVGHFANDLGGGPEPRFAMPHYPVKRLMLECSTIGEIVQLLRRVPLWANGNYVLCDGLGAILDVEATPEGPFSLTDNGTGFISHSNHFLCAEHATKENHQRSAADSFSRLARMNQLIAARFGQLGVEDLKKLLRDRQGDPTGICRYAQTADPTADWVTAGITAASIIARPAQRQLFIAAGNDVNTPFELYRMEDG